MTEIKKESGGAVRIADEVLATIAGTAALEVEGVAGLAKQKSRGAAVAVKGNTVALSLNIVVRMGAKLHDISVEAQQRVKSAIETMTGLNVAEVNISIGAVVGEKYRA